MEISCCCFPFAILLSVAGTVFWVWTLVDCLMKEPAEGNDKIIWVLVIIFASWIGCLIYVLVRRPQRIQRYGQ